MHAYQLNWPLRALAHVATALTVGALFVASVGLYIFTFAAMWNWYAAPLLHLQPMTFWWAYGLTLLGGLVRGRQPPPEDGTPLRQRIVALFSKPLTVLALGYVGTFFL